MLVVRKMVMPTTATSLSSEQRYWTMNHWSSERTGLGSSKMSEKVLRKMMTW